jgi:hypothetical protein
VTHRWLTCAFAAAASFTRPYTATATRTRPYTRVPPRSGPRGQPQRAAGLVGRGTWLPRVARGPEIRSYGHDQDPVRLQAALPGAAGDRIWVVGDGLGSRARGAGELKGLVPPALLACVSGPSHDCEPPSAMTPMASPGLQRSHTNAWAGCARAVGGGGGLGLKVRVCARRRVRLCSRANAGHEHRAAPQASRYVRRETAELAAAAVSVHPVDRGLADTAAHEARAARGT